MSKSSSLKKLQAGTLKNQKSITHFFKKPNENKVNLTTETQEIPNEPIKRKAISPLNSHLNLGVSSILQNSPKKHKREHHLESVVKNRSDVSKHDNFSEEPKCNKDTCSSKIIREESKRSPLTPVSDDFIKNVSEKLNNHVVEYLDKQSCKENENHELWSKLLNTPEKKKLNPKNNSGSKVINSPKFAKFTPEKTSEVERTPSKHGATVKILDFPEEEDMFGDDWQVDEMEEFSENLDLSTVKRCEVLSVVPSPHQVRLELKLKSSSSEKGTCVVEGIWADTNLSPGDIISITATRNSSGQWSVSNTAGLLVLRPDHLISTTSVAGAVFCKRKAVLQERWKGIDSANSAMTIGILIHELVQKALTEDIRTTATLREEAGKLLKGSVQMLYDAGLSEDEARNSIETYIQPLANFMLLYMSGTGSQAMQPQKGQWSGYVDKVLDIEENLCCPQLGLKGKIDATLEVTIHERREKLRCTVPLELKSGKASMSAEHRGQVVMYGMMLSVLKHSQPTTDMQRGLLLYLRDRVDLREVSCGYPERRDLIMLRNELVSYLAQGPQQIDPEQLTDIEQCVSTLQQRLPEPVHHETACAKCPYVTLCSAHLWHTEGPTVPPNHPLAKLREQAIGHLTPTHIKYFLHWTALLKMEERGQMSASPLHALWTDSVEKRIKRGTCASNLGLNKVDVAGDRFKHSFVRKTTGTSGPLEGEFSIVSTEHRPWIAAGVVSLTSDKEVHILLERDLSRRQNKDTLYHIDTYESYATTVQNLTNLGVLLEDSNRSLRLRNLIIDKDPPEFEKKLPREVGKLGVKMMRSLNIQQQRAVLKAISAKDYALLQGLPGTGKTQTISVLIQMLVALKQRVLVTAHTHSAVDTVLTRLPNTLRIMRLGSTGRVAPGLLDRCEQKLVASCENPEQLAKLYESMEVVGVTCLGAAHAMLTRTIFDVCIVDEATQVLQCTVLRPLFACKRFVLVGDPEQLPPVVRSRAARRFGMEESLFHRLMSSEATSTLQLQYRMNQPITDVANRVAYNDRLKCACDTVASARVQVDIKKVSSFTTSPWLIKACSPGPEDATIFIDMKLLRYTGSGATPKSLENVDEANVVTVLVKALMKGGVKYADIGVIAPYRDQVSLLRRMLSVYSVEVSTVDQFQGRDKSVIVYSCTRWADTDDKKAKEGEILNDQRRLAVSVTRAKHKFIVIGNSKALQRYEPVHRLIQECTCVELSSEDWNLIQKYKEDT